MRQEHRRISAILLAAGKGTRFGGDKLLHPLEDGVAIGAHAARNLAAAGLAVIAVVKPGDFPLADMLEQEGCYVTVCPGASHGMGVSLAHGIAQSRGEDGWIVALADMPRIRPETIRRVVQALEDGADIVVPVYHDERGHPVGFSARFRNELEALSGDSGARAVLQRHAGSITRIDCDDPAVTQDIDRPGDLTG